MTPHPHPIMAPSALLAAAILTPVSLAPPPAAAPAPTPRQEAEAMWQRITRKEGEE